MPTNIDHHQVAKNALEILLRQKYYTQKEIHQKLQYLNISLSRASISNIWNNKSQPSPNLIYKVSQGLQLLLKRDFCLAYNESTKTFEAIPNCEVQTVTELKLDRDISQDKEKTSDLIIRDGRPDVKEKVALYTQAKYEIMEVGIRLNNFANYFSSKRDSAFREPLYQQLERGVHFSCYVLDGGGNIARRYMEDRARVQPTEMDTFKDIPNATNRLRDLFLEINKKGFPGKMRLFKYDHFPYFHSSVIDGETERGKMYFSSYLYGISRANAPVIELNRQQDPVLFQRYWKSISIFANPKKAQPIV